MAGADSLVAHDPVDVAAQVRAARGEDTDCAVVLAVDDNRLNDGQTHGHVRRDRDRCRDADGLYSPKHDDKRAEEGNGQSEG